MTLSPRILEAGPDSSAGQSVPLLRGRPLVRIQLGASRRLALVPTADERKRKRITAMQVKLLNPPIKALAAYGLVPTVALLETTGRTSGQPRRTPVSKGLDRATGTFWIVAEHGRKAAYVRNIETDPHVRIRIGRRWRSGTATVLGEDDPLARQRHMSKLNAATVRAMGTDLLTIRVDLTD